MEIVVSCPAKINTFLAVGRPDARGWHPLRTIFQAIDLCDEIVLSSASRDGFETNWDSLPAENTLTRTLAEVRQFIDVPPVHISLHKRIPAESGLGGGSSNAASLLRALEAFTSQLVPNPAEIALRIGADVPFFLLGGRAKAEGYGEILTPMADLPERWLVIARPPIGCSTPTMFKALDELNYPWRDFPIEDEIYNDFERVMPGECGELIERLLIQGASASGLSGSGSAVFGIFPSESLALRASKEMNSWAEIWVVPTLAGSTRKISV